MRKITTIFLLSIFLFSEAGYFLYYGIQRYSIKQEIKKKHSSAIEQQLLEVIELEANQPAIEWEEEGEEFAFNGNMYDVKRSEKKDGKTFLYCINDEKETLLLKKMVDAAENNQKEKKNNSYKFQLSDFVVANTLSSSLFDAVIETDFFSFDESGSSLSIEIAIPPPRFV